ncbi:hypothetical protein B0T16DRAFT_336339 [Cercophora newfieldiana]|uniref:Uncharacterized protein n=1 Tax=Cercophora newfieldiana TaxID=92897 RepID=A0AA40CLA3_9PEZI|nr:hypothetical protein B0T16DRAFT_336339 [Cercophora newfieldiana]
MAKERDSDVSGTSQSKTRPAFNRIESSDQTQQSHQQHHRAKGTKHVVGGIGSRLHARVPSSKALQKHHAAASTTKLNRRRSLSPDHADTAGPPLTSGHRRATSDLKLSGDAPTSSHIRKNSSHTSLKRNRSQVDVGKKTKSATNLKRTLSNPAVQKLRSNGGSKVHFNLGDDQDEFDPDDEENQDDEWVDASTSASPLLSRRGSTATGAEQQTADDGAKTTTTGDALDRNHLGSFGGAQSLSQSGGRALASHNQYLTSRILQRTPSHGAPPKMSVENVSALTGPSRQDSPDSGLGHDTSTLSGTPRNGNQVRPGSSGQELTSRFVGNNSQEPGSEIPVDSFLAAAAHHGGISRAAANGKAEANGVRRPKSTGNLSMARGRNGNNVHGLGIAAAAAAAAAAEDTLTDEEDVDGGVLSVEPRSRRNRGYVVPTDMSRTQQKLNLQRASSSLETAHPHPAMGMGLGVPVAAGPLVGASGYDTRDPRLSRILERTGTEYLVVRRYQNPIARSLARLAQLPGMDKIRPIPRTGTGNTTRPSTAHSKRGSELGGGRPGPGLVIREREREPSVATLIGGQAARRPMTPRSAFASSRRLTNHSVSSSLDTDEEGRGMQHERQSQSQAHRLSGSSLVNGEDDAGTLAILRNMWDKNMDLSASQE